MKTIILTDSCSDLPYEYIEKNQIEVTYLHFLLNGKDYPDDLGQSLPYQEFYAAVRQGAMPTTSQINAHSFVEIFTKHAQKGEPLIYIAFSSALSGTYNSAVAAKEMVLEDYPEAKISLVDSRSASLGLGLLVHYAVELRDQGQSSEEITNWLEANKLRLNHWFTVEDLHHLKRGGRVSGTAAFVGSMLDVKPVLNIDREGRLIPIAKVRGRNKSLKYLKDQLGERIEEAEKQVIFISHGDSLGDAEHLKEIILESYPVKEVVIGYVGPVIGAHSGPGTIALFFMGQER
ncbi:MAG: DegV family protein [Bacillota bacterium]